MESNQLTVCHRGNSLVIVTGAIGGVHGLCNTPLIHHWSLLGGGCSAPFVPALSQEAEGATVMTVAAPSGLRRTVLSLLFLLKRQDVKLSGDVRVRRSSGAEQTAQSLLSLLMEADTH